MFDIHGKEIWERHLGSSISQAITAGDTDGDGEIEIVVATHSGHVHVIMGTPFNSSILCIWTQALKQGCTREIS